MMSSDDVFSDIFDDVFGTTSKLGLIQIRAGNLFMKTPWMDGQMGEEPSAGGEPEYKSTRRATSLFLLLYFSLSLFLSLNSPLTNLKSTDRADRDLKLETS